MRTTIAGVPARTRIMVLVLGVLLTACSSGGTGSGSGATTSPPTPVAAAPSGKYPNAIAVLGHSGATGYDSDPNAQGRRRGELLGHR